MNEKKNPKTAKAIAFLKKHERKIDLIATASIAFGAGILYMAAVTNSEEKKQWEKARNSPLFKDDAVITRDQKGETYYIKVVNQETYDNA